MGKANKGRRIDYVLQGIVTLKLLIRSPMIPDRPYLILNPFSLLRLNDLFLIQRDLQLLVKKTNLFIRFLFL